MRGACCVRLITLVAIGLLASPGLALGQAPPSPPWALSMDDAVPIRVPAAIRNNLDLEYEDTDSIRGVLVDLNHDGVTDYLIQAAPSLCGNGGCPYALIDGVTGRSLGEVFGNPIYVLPAQGNGLPTLASYSHESANSGTYTTYTFKDTAYVVTETRLMKGPARDSLVAALGHIPLWKPRP